MKQVLILEDVALSRKWMAGITRKVFPDIKIFEAATLAAAHALISQNTFDLALIDLNLPDGEGYQILRQLSAVAPDTVTIVTTVMASDSAVVSALSAGATGYLLKSDPPEQIERHLRQLVNGVPALSPSIARRIMDHFRKTAPSFEPAQKLTQREQEVLHLIARGLRVSEAATMMGVAESTVATHVKSIYRKLDISNRAEAATEAAKMGLI